MLHHPSTTAVRAGSGAWQAMRQSVDKQTLVIADDNIAFDGPALRVDACNADIQTVRALADRMAEHTPRAVLGVGGGSVLDLVKLASLVHADPRIADVLETWGERAGAITPPNDQRSVMRRILVPTTVGTGVEVSAVACVQIGKHKRIVISNALRPDLAVLDPDLTATLPSYLLREGMLEALLRIIGPVAGSPRLGGLPDAEAEMLVKQLVATGDRIAAGDTDPDTRLMAATLSAATHTGWALAGRETFGTKHWYLANELATTLGLRKMVATACLLPTVWSRIAQGDTRYGNPSTLAMAWNWLDESDPVNGIRALLRRWRIEHEVDASAPAISEAAERAERSWGGRLPMLAKLTATEIEELYTEALGLPCHV